MLLFAREASLTRSIDRLAVSGPSEITKEQPESGGQYTQSQADLEAQQSMAAAAWTAAAVSFLALCGLFATIFYARKAWIAAKDSASADNEALALTRTQLDEARESTQAQAIKTEQQVAAMRASAKAAQEHAAITRDVSQKQSRAYVHTTKASLKKYPVQNAFNPQADQFLASLAVQNVGRTIATDVRIEFKFSVATMDEAIQTQPVTSPKFIRTASIAPGQTAPIDLFQMALIAPFVRQIAQHNSEKADLEPNLHLLFWGQIVYSDVYGGRHRTGYQYISSGGVLAVGGLFPITIDGPAFEQIPPDQ